MKPHILTVDDEPSIRGLLKEFLELKGYRVSAVATPAEALRVVDADRPQLIITDVQLDQADGLQLVGQLKHRMPSVPIIVLTGVLQEADIPGSSAAKDIEAVLSKTDSLNIVFDAVRRLLGAAPGKNSAPEGG